MFNPGTLWSKTLEKTTSAIQHKALHSISSKWECVEQNGVKFLVHLVSKFARTDEAREKQTRNTAGIERSCNPFLPYDEARFVTDISDTHVCLLNKFNLVEHQLLIITRPFEEQTSLLTVRDFEAMWLCMAEFEGLVFYNGGEKAGASQKHKHFQMVPLPLTLTGPKIPIEPLLSSAIFQGSLGRTHVFPFVHVITRVDLNWVESPIEGAHRTLERYYAMLRAVGLLDETSGSTSEACGAYNLLVTREWMLLVPRSKRFFASIAVNALGFAGVLLVKDEKQLKILKTQGPMTVLRQVALTSVAHTHSRPSC